MTSNPPPYAPGETTGLQYPAVQGYPQMQQVPGVYYQQQWSPALSGAPGVASVTYYPPGPQQQQPQQLVISQPPPVVIAAPQRPPSFVCHIILSCFVTWCCFCCLPCGIVAFVLASKFEFEFEFSWSNCFSNIWKWPGQWVIVIIIIIFRAKTKLEQYDNLSIRVFVNYFAIKHLVNLRNKPSIMTSLSEAVMWIWFGRKQLGLS